MKRLITCLSTMLLLLVTTRAGATDFYVKDSNSSVRVTYTLNGSEVELLDYNDSGHKMVYRNGNASETWYKFSADVPANTPIKIVLAWNNGTYKANETTYTPTTDGIVLTGETGQYIKIEDVNSSDFTATPLENLTVYIESEQLNSPYNNPTVTLTRDANENIYRYTFTSTKDEDVYFRLKVSEWNTEIHPMNGGDAVPENGGVLTNGDYWGLNSDKAWKIPCEAGSKYTIIFDHSTTDDNGKILSIIYLQKETKKSYYVVFPGLAEDNKDIELRMAPSRVRGGGAYSSRYYSCNFKYDLSKAADTYKFYIKEVEGDNIVHYYRPTADKEFTGSGSSEVKAGTDKGVKLYSDGNPATNGTGVFSFSKNLGKSFTILFDADAPSGNMLKFLANPNNCGLGDGAENKDYYLIGNFENASADIDINPSQRNGRRKLTRYIYPIGTSDIASADSVVYQVTVPRPAAGWSELYLAVASQELINEWPVDNSGDYNDQTSNNYKWSECWRNVIRPQVHWFSDGFKSDANSAYTAKDDGMDATALHGGLFTKTVDAGSQALNPLIEDDPDSYTFRMNITTSTYEIIFNRNLFIIGPAIGTECTDAEGWSSASPEESTEHAKLLVWDEKEQCYKFLGDEGTGEEQKIYFNGTKKFRFCYNKDFRYTLREDDVVPSDLSTADKQKANYVLNEEDTGNKDTQYVNFLWSYTSSDINEKEHGETHDAGDIVFNLPSGDYKIRLYIRDTENEGTKYYYMIDREFPLADRTESLGTHGDYNWYRTFSDYHAIVLPDDVDMLVANNYQKNATGTDGTVNIENVEYKDAKGVRYVPAGMPVILASKSEPSSSKNGFAHYEEPNITAENENNCLMPLIYSQGVPTYSTENGIEYKNYGLGNKKWNSSDTQYTLAFYPSSGNGKASNNLAYLRINKNLVEGTTAYSKGIKIVFEDSGNLPTGIMGIDDVAREDDSAYYTVSGTRLLGKPATKGIYIHNGRKVIIK